MHAVPVPRDDAHDDGHALPHGDDDGRNHNRIHRRHRHGDDGGHGDAHDVRVILSPYPSYIYPPAYCF